MHLMPRYIGLFMLNFAQFPFMATTGKIISMDYSGSNWGFLTTGSSMILQGIICLFIWRPVSLIGYKTSLILGTVLLIAWILAFLQITYFSYWDICKDCGHQMSTSFLMQKKTVFIDVAIGALIGALQGSFQWAANTMKSVDETRFGTKSFVYVVILGALPAGMFFSAGVSYLLPVDPTNDQNFEIYWLYVVFIALIVIATLFYTFLP